MTLTEYIFKGLPKRYTLEDTYPDANGDGIFKRIMTILGNQLDGLVSDIDNILTKLFTEDRYVKLHAESIGNVLSMWGNLLLLRKSNQNWDYINSIKGTRYGYDYMFLYILGMPYVLTIIPNGGSLFDSNVLFDSTAIFDNNCSLSRDYTLALTIDTTLYPQFIDPLNITKQDMDALMAIIFYMEPMDLNLLTLSINTVTISTGGYSSGFSSGYNI